jgi:AcrR family transcriptional regulator
LSRASPQKLGLPNKNYSFFSGYEIFLRRAILGCMQYLSQRLAVEPARTPEKDRPRGPVAVGQRERILAATERLVAEKGCAKTTIEGIVKAAGVSSVTFYEHFRDKEECLVAAFDRAVEEESAALGEAVATEDSSWPERLRAVLRALLDAIEAEPARARMGLVEAQMGGRELRAHYEAALDRVAAELREGRALDSAPRDLPVTLEEATAGGLAWLLRERLELGGGGDVADLYPRMVDIALSPYLADGAAPRVAAEPAPHDG